MKTTKLTVAEITELQPTAVSYAAERGAVLGGIEVSGDCSQEEIASACQKFFGEEARINDAEAMDGDDCIHYIVIRA